MFRSRRRMKKSFYFVLFIIVFFSISVGYAFLNATLTISGKSAINKNTWNVYFDNLFITPGSVTATDDPIIEGNDKVSNFSFTLNTLGDFYEFSVDIINDGTIDAMIDSISKTPELTDEQKKYLSYTIEYYNGEQILKNQLVKANEFVRIKVRVEFKKDITASDLPQTGQVLNLGFNVNYIQAESNGVVVKDNGLNITPTANGSLDDIGTVVTIGSEKFYTIGTEGDNVKLLSMYNLYVGNEVTDMVMNDEGSDVSVVNELTNPTGKQSSKAKGLTARLISNGGEPIFPWVGTIEFANEQRHGTNHTDYEGSIVEGYVNDYKNKLVDRFGVNVVDARLITKNELTNPDTFACDEEEWSCINSPYPWIYSTSYWTETVYDTDRIYGVFSIGFMEFVSFDADDEIGVRPVIVMPKSDILVPEIKPIANGNINKIGTIVTIGTEQFYTIGTEGDNVKLLSMYNLMVGDVVFNIGSNWSEVDKLNILNATGMQSSYAKGAIVEYDGENEKLLFPWYGTVAFSSEERHGINYSDYSGSIVEGYVNDYKTKLENKFGVDITEARLITKDELINPDTFACNAEEGGCINSHYPWIYSTSYWSGSSFDESLVLVVGNDSSFGTSIFSLDFIPGVRPVIVVPKSYFE